MSAIANLLPSAVLTLPLGVLVAGLSVLAYGWSIRQQTTWRDFAFERRKDPINWRAVAVVAAIVLVGLIIRLWGLDEKTLTHPEAYIPGIVLPPGISEPPSRYGFYETLWWHFHGEPHPMGFYMAMWAWVKLFGTSLIALRLPIVLIGTLSIYLIYRLATDLYGRAVGYLSAALLALHGLHIYWSQISRMYVPGTALGLIATILLMRMAKREKPNLLYEGLYLGCLVVGTSVQLFFWLLMGLHIVWVILNHRATSGATPRIAVLLMAGIALSSPNMIQALYTAYDAVLPGPTFGFLLELYNFGFAFETDQFSQPARSLPVALAVILSLACLGLALRGLTVRQQIADNVGLTATAKSVRPLFGLALGMTVLCLGLTDLAWRETEKLIWVSLLPVAALIVLPIVRYLSPWADTHGLAALRKTAWGAALVSPIGLLGLVAAPMIFIGSFYQTVLAPRAFMIFVPYLLILVAAGLLSLRPHRFVALPGVAALLIVFSLSTAHFKATPNSPRDYQGLAEILVPELQQDDMIFVLKRNWWQTPVFYYLDHDRLVGENYAAEVAENPQARIWFIVIEGLEADLNEEMVSSVASTHSQTRSLDVLGHRAILFEPNEETTDQLRPTVH